MSKLPVISGRKVLKILLKQGYVLVSQKGSHVKLRKEGNTIIVPLHRKPLKKGTLLSILDQAGLTKKEFLMLIR
tara:strand:+ start:323 stop:544 length:222 start_codon:yes stop_codon:yes gene_type:complete